MKIKVEAICLKTHVDEDDMQRYCDGDIKCPSDVKIYHKGRKYLVVEKYVDKKFYKIIEMTIDDHLQNIGKHRKVAKMIYAIDMLRDAECEDDVLNAIAIKKELNWMEVQDELKDCWNDYFGDAKKYLP